MVPDGGDGGAAVSVVDADDAAVRAARHDEVLALNGVTNGNKFSRGLRMRALS